MEYIDVSPTSERVPRHTDDRFNERIRRWTECNLSFYGRQGRQAIDGRLEELDQEWDIERTLEANAAAVSLAGFMLGAFVHRRWYLLPAMVSIFLLQHAIQGWCPPVRFFRRMGTRTEREISYERYGLKALRGDFRGLPQDTGEAIPPEKIVEVLSR